MVPELIELKPRQDDRQMLSIGVILGALRFTDLTYSA